MNSSLLEFDVSWSLRSRITDSDPDHLQRKQPTDVTMVTFGGLVKRNNIVQWNFGFDF